MQSRKRSFKIYAEVQERERERQTFVLSELSAFFSSTNDLIESISICRTGLEPNALLNVSIILF